MSGDGNVIAAGDYQHATSNGVYRHIGYLEVHEYSNGQWTELGGGGVNRPPIQGRFINASLGKPGTFKLSYTGHAIAVGEPNTNMRTQGMYPLNADLAGFINNPYYIPGTAGSASGGGFWAIYDYSSDNHLFQVKSLDGIRNVMT